MKTLALILAMIPVSAPAFASGENGGSDSCGLGWQVTQKKSILATSTRYTTNVTVPPTFGMSSGTIGCDQHTFAKNELPALQLIATSQDAIMIDIASGGGEHFEALAQAIRCVDVESLAHRAQADYPALAASSPIALLREMKALCATEL